MLLNNCYDRAFSSNIYLDVFPCEKSNVIYDEVIAGIRHCNAQGVSFKGYWNKKVFLDHLRWY